MTPSTRRRGTARRLTVFAAVLIATVLLVPLTMRGQAAPPAAQNAAGDALRIATANPGRILQEMAERNEMKTKLDAEIQSLGAEEQQRVQKIKELQAARDLLKQETPQWEDANRQLLTASIELRTWTEVSKNALDNRQKQQIKTLYGKIVEAIGEVAQQRGIDLVIADQQRELPQNVDQMSVQQLRAELTQRDVLYSAAKVDISGDVIALLDKKYREKK